MSFGLYAHITIILAKLSTFEILNAVKTGEFIFMTFISFSQKSVDLCCYVMDFCGLVVGTPNVDFLLKAYNNLSVNGIC